MNRGEWAVRVALGLTLVIGALSVFLIVIGSPGSEVSAPCFNTADCSKLSRTVFSPTPQAVVPLILGGLVALGLVGKEMTIAWAGTVLLLVFSLLTGFSIGLFYLPSGLTLVALVAVIQSRRRTP